MALVLQIPAFMNQLRMKKKRILVIDPDHDFCKNVSLFLEENYYIDIRKGLDYIDHTIILKKIDLLIIEADFADKNLVDLLKRLKENHGNLKILIMYTYFPSDHEIERQIGKGADDMIAKPFDVYLLKKKVDKLLKSVNNA